MNFRNLTAAEISRLEGNSCRCADWSRVTVAEPFNPDHYRNAEFSGDVTLGTTEKTHMLEGCVPAQSGVYDAMIHNCQIGNDVLIRRIGNVICNYHIGHNTVIENTASLVMTGDSTFGNGVEVSVLNETGGREVPIVDRLSAQVAYMVAMYRHDPNLTAALRRLLNDYAESRRSTHGTVGENVTITNAGTIRDVYIGPHARIDGVTRLTNGSVMSEADDPVKVGNNVVADDFIISAGAKVDAGTVMVHTFVGQATELTRLFSAHDSLFFANCACENGESAAIFAGPYTVTMHKSSLLIAGMFSFLNAGSGSNQSNHMYKLGPIHQGVVDRGSKTTSDSYILWPAHVGAFSLVMGRHVSHSDTSRLPFSYLIETAGSSHLVPGVNLKSVGTIRDAMKWPKRDKRRTRRPLDLINFNLLSPYTVQRMFAGIDLLNSIEATSGCTSTAYSYQGMTITASALRKGRKYYAMAIDKFMGNALMKRLEGAPIKDEADLQNRLARTHEAGAGEWLDIAGLFLPKSEIKAIIADLNESRINSLDALNERFQAINDAYYDMEWTWIRNNFERWYGKTIDQITVADVREIAKRWHSSVVAIDNLLYDDARKEFNNVSRTGFGLDTSSDRNRASDFESVRGDFDRDPFVTMVLHHIQDKTRIYSDLLERLPQ